MKMIAEFLNRKMGRIVSVDALSYNYRELQEILDAPEGKMVRESLFLKFEESWNVKVELHIHLKWAGKHVSKGQEYQTFNVEVQLSWPSFGGDTPATTAFLSVAQEVNVLGARLLEFVRQEIGLIASAIEG